MITIVSLLVAAALVSQQCGFEANAQIEDSNLNMDNNLAPNVIPTPKRQHRKPRNFVRILTQFPEEVRREPAERIELQCEAAGLPPPTVRWEVNGETVVDYEEEANEIMPLASGGVGIIVSKLVLTSTAPGAAEYTCVASNGLKRDQASTTVFTLPAVDDLEEELYLEKLLLVTKPTITYYYNSLFPNIGSSAILPCRVHSVSPTQLQWIDPMDRPVRDNYRMTMLPSGDLLINSVKWPEDRGNYTCVVKNLYGQDKAVTFILPTKKG